jgi:hypothetical protein
MCAESEIGSFTCFEATSILRALTVVGVARDVKRTELRAPSPLTVYLPRPQRREDGERFNYAMRTVADAAGVAPAGRAANCGSGS